MRAYFLTNGRIVEAIELPDLSVEEAVKQIKSLFEAASGKFDAFEIWGRTRRIYRHGQISRRKKAAREPMLLGR